MGTGTLVDHLSGDIIEAADPNDIHAALKGDFVGRDTTGAAASGQRLGTPLIPWGTAYITDLVLDGSPIDPAEVATFPNRVVSGKTRATSDFPDYLRPAGVGGGLQFTVLATATPLKYDVNGVIIEASADIVKTGLTGAPATNNTCQVNDASLTGQDVTRFLGDNGGFIPVDNMGSELTSRVGEFVALLHQTTGEIIYCRIESTTKLSNCKRGFFFDDNGDPIPADVLSNNDTLQLLSLGFVFAEDDGSTIDVTYNNPIVGGNEPGSPATGDYWYDFSVNVWKRYSGSAFVEIDRTFIGVVASGTTSCRAARPEYFSKGYRPDNTLTIKLLDFDNVISSHPNAFISVDGEKQKYDFGFLTWAASTDFETGFTRTVDRYYWIYLTEDGTPKISGYKPYDSLYFQRGWYHPYESWRAVGQVYNNASNDFELINESDETLNKLNGVSYLPYLSPIANNATDANNDIDFSPRRFTFSDYSGIGCVHETLTKRLDANWSAGDGAGGLDTGSKAADTTYHCYAIYSISQDCGDYIFSLSASAPTLPTGYVKYRRIGSIITDSSSNILGFKQRGKWFDLNVWINEWDLLVAPTTRTNYTWTLPTGVKVRANMHTFIQTDIANRIGAVIISDPDSPDQQPTIGPLPIFTLLVQRTSAANNVNGALHVTTNTSAQVALRGTQNVGSESPVDISAVNIGWEDYQLEE